MRKRGNDHAGHLKFDHSRVDREEKQVAFLLRINLRDSTLYDIIFIFMGIMAAEYIQLDLFEGFDEKGHILAQVRLLKSQQDNLRKGLFGRYNDLSKEFMKVLGELEQMKLEVMKLKQKKTCSFI